MLASESPTNTSDGLSIPEEDSLQIVNQEIIESDSDSDLSLSDKIIIESNEKRLKQRLDTLQTSIQSLKQQLSVEKQLWKEDIEKIKYYQKQRDCNKICPIHAIKPKDIFSMHDANRNVPSLLFNDHCTCKAKMDVMYNNNLSKSFYYLEMENYKQKIAETEKMCTVELNKLRQNIHDLNTLKQYANGDWKDETNNIDDPNEKIQELFIAKSI